MLVRIAAAKDFADIIEIYRLAREYMAENGNPHQWGDDGYPYESIVKEDIEKKRLYVIEEGGAVQAVFMFDFGPDVTYGHIDGKWLNERPYGVIHRIAGSGRMKGVLSECVKFCSTKTDNLRIDTHSDNHIMQRALEKNGFVYCGTIYLENGDARMAYQLSRNG